MKRIVFALALLLVALACAESQADFRCRSRRIVSPCFTPTVCHEQVVHHAAVIAPTTTIIQQAVPTFLFQYVGQPPAFAQPPYQPSAYQPPAAFAPPTGAAGMALTDAQMDRIATMVAQKLAGTAAITQNTLLQAPPMLSEETPTTTVEMSQAIANDIGMKCASCHMTGTATKGGLAIFDQNRQFNPTKGGAPYARPELIWQRAQSGEMPPSATTDPSKRLNAESIAFLRSAIGQ